jgi:zinc transport system substrate-binding protein
MRWTLRVAGALLAAVVVVNGLTACGLGRNAGADGKTFVVAAFYPLQFLAERIGGDHVFVTNLVKPGAEPHDLELTPHQVGDISEADLVVYLGGFQPAVDEAIIGEAKRTSLDVSKVQPLTGNQDPHVWLDPVRFAAIGDKVAERLAAVDQTNATTYQSRAAELHRELATLDGDYAAGLKSCDRQEIVTSHAAFGYLASRYKLHQIPISGLNPDEEPSAKRLSEVSSLARQHGVTTIFFETLVSPKLAETLAREVGAKSEVLDPIEGLEDTAKGDYVSVMRANLTKLRAALGCR